MKRLLLASVGLVAMATAATAADLAARPVTKAPAFIPPPLYNWSGFYIGGHLGWAGFELGETFVTPAGTVFNNGFFDDRGRVDAFIGGGQAGFNYQAGAWVFGVEGQISAVNIDRDRRHDGFVVIGGVNNPMAVVVNARVDFLATLAGRIGYAFGPTGNFLVYAKGGGAWLGFSGCGRATVNGVTTFNGGCGDDTLSGWMVGGGAEWGFAPNWSIKAEYNFLDFSDHNNNNIVFGPGPFNNTIGFGHDLQTHIVKVGLNWRFGDLFR